MTGTLLQFKALYDGNAALMAALPGGFFAVEARQEPPGAYAIYYPIGGSARYTAGEEILEECGMTIMAISRTAGLAEMANIETKLKAVFDNTEPGDATRRYIIRRATVPRIQYLEQAWHMWVDYNVMMHPL